MRIPFHRPYITDDEIESVTATLRSGWTTMGNKTAQFERNFAEYIGAPCAIAVNSGTAALHCALASHDIGTKDEVIVPATTFIATAEAVEYCRASPVFVDIDRETHCINTEKIPDKLTSRTKAIIPVHFSGQPCDMDAIIKIATDKKLTVIEDAAHALPAWYGKKKIGIIGDMTCFSFYATKTLATGEGGMIATFDKDRAERIRVMLLHGMTRDAWKRYSGGASWEYDVEQLGYKYNTTDLNSSIGIEQLNKQGFLLEARTRIAERYSEAFNQNEALLPYFVKDGRISSWHLYPLKLNLDSLTITRDRFIKEMYERGISTSVHFIPLYRFTFYRKLGIKSGDFPDSEWVFERVVSLPIYPGMSDEEIFYVIDTILDIVRIYKR